MCCADHCPVRAMRTFKCFKTGINKVLGRRKSNNIQFGISHVQQRSQPDDLVLLCKIFVFIDGENDKFLKK